MKLIKRDYDLGPSWLNRYVWTAIQCGTNIPPSDYAAVQLGTQNTQCSPKTTLRDVVCCTDEDPFDLPPPIVLRISGCSVPDAVALLETPTASTVDCPVEGVDSSNNPIVLTIAGRNFGINGATILIGGVTCQNPTYLSPTPDLPLWAPPTLATPSYMTCLLPGGTGVEVPVTVVRGSATSADVFDMIAGDFETLNVSDWTFNVTVPDWTQLGEGLLGAVPVSKVSASSPVANSLMVVFFQPAPAKPTTLLSRNVIVDQLMLYNLRWKEVLRDQGSPVRLEVLLFWTPAGGGTQQQTTLYGPRIVTNAAQWLSYQIQFQPDRNATSFRVAFRISAITPIGGLSQTYLLDGVGLSFLAPSISYVIPKVQQVSGCANIGTSTTQCSTNSSTLLTISGSNFGDVEPQIFVGPFACTGVVFLTPQTNLTCTIPNGTLTNMQITIFSANGRSLSNENATVSYRQCLPGTKTVTQGATASCVSCAPGSFSDVEGSKVCIDCPTGRMGNATGLSTCAACEIGKYTSITGQVNCSSCPQGRVAQNPGTSDCTVCPPGSYYSTNISQPIPICVKCVPGYFQNFSAQTACVACNIGEHQDVIGQLSCKSCDPGRYNNITSQATCQPCEQGKYNPSAQATDCLPCATGKYVAGGPNGQITCDSCRAGTYTNITGQSSCTSCPAGRFQDFPARTQCGDCTVPTYSELGAVRCELCPLGTQWDLNVPLNLGYCLDCPAGYFGKVNVFGNFNISSCDPCPVGTIQPKTASLRCDQCSLGKFNPNVTGTRCDMCPHGRKGPSRGLSVCPPCDPGKFNAIDGQSTCADCTIGTFSHDPGSWNCSTCVPGKYASQPGLSICSDCDPGRFAVGDGTMFCSPCVIGKSAPQPGATQCTPCQQGEAQDQSGQATCYPCPKGKFSATDLSVRCGLCQSGKYSDRPGMTECLTCGIGTYSSQNATLEEIFTLVNITGPTICTPCEIGRYTQQNGTRGGCSACPPGTRSDLTSGSTTCVQCDPGAYQSLQGAGVCVSCEPGKKTEANGQASCAECEAGRFQPLPGQTTCIPCDPGLYQQKPGATNCTRCEVGRFVTAPQQKSCALCPIGRYSMSLGRSDDCEFCLPGTFGNRIGLSVCSNCTVGTYILVLVVLHVLYVNQEDIKILLVNLRVLSVSLVNPVRLKA